MEIRKILFFSLLILLVAACGKDDDGFNDDDPNLEPITLSGTQDVPLVLTNIFNDPSRADYIIPGGWRIEAAVTVEPGVRFEMASGANIETRSAGSFAAIGTAEDPIYFEGEQAARGFWNYIMFNSNNPSNALTHCIISHGGGSTSSAGNASVIVRGNAQAAVSNTVISESARNGLRINDDDARLTLFENNQISNCDQHPISLRTSHLGVIDATTEFAVDNGFNSIKVDGNAVLTALTINSAAGPYLFEGNTRFEASTEVMPGTQIRMGPAARIEVRSSGSLSMIGTPTQRISVRGDQDAKGYWEYIYYNSSNSPNNEINYADFSYGGGSTSSCCGGIIVLRSALLSMGNSSLNNSQRFGMIVPDNSTFDDLGGNTFDGNELGDIGN